MLHFITSKLLVIGSILLLSINSNPAQATSQTTVLQSAELVEQLNQLLKPNNQAALYSPQGKAIYHHGTGTFIPASIIKILTSLVALKQLGEDYSFVTKLWRDGAGRLIIQGNGDPLLLSEEIALMAKQLNAKNHNNFTRLMLDDSRIRWQLTPGSENTNNPYDAPNGALLVNFNTINLRVTPAGVIHSAEPQTPLIALAQTIGQQIKPGTTERINIGFNLKRTREYVHQLVIALFEQNQINIASHAQGIAQLDGSEELILSYQNSRRLKAQVGALLTYSNNYLANQIGLVMLLESNRVYQAPASIAEATRLVSDYAYTQLKIKQQSLVLKELSGLSRDNKISLEAIGQILTAFMPYASLMQNYHKEAAIPADSNLQVNAKSGSLDGITNLAGYISTSKRTYSFIIHTNTDNNRNAILKLLVKLSLI